MNKINIFPGTDDENIYGLFLTNILEYLLEWEQKYFFKLMKSFIPSKDSTSNECMYVCSARIRLSRILITTFRNIGTKLEIYFILKVA